MEVKVIAVGNSKGIVLNKTMLKQAGIGEAKTLEAIVENGSIILRPKKLEVSYAYGAGMIKATKPMPSLEEMKRIASEGWIERDNEIAGKEIA